MEGKSLLKVMSYNIHSGKDKDMVCQLDNIISFLGTEKIDIIGLQEINENNIRGYQVTKIGHCLKLNSSFSPNVKIGRGYYGTGILTSFSILENKQISLPSVKEQRSLHHNILNIDNRRLSILNTHLGLDFNERIIQLKLIEEYLNFINTPYILMGDFNTDKPLFQNINAMDTGKLMKMENIPTLGSSCKRIDFIYTSKSIEVMGYKVFNVNMSDHYPIMVEIEF